MWNSHFYVISTRPALGTSALAEEKSLCQRNRDAGSKGISLQAAPIKNGAGRLHRNDRGDYLHIEKLWAKPPLLGVSHNKAASR